VPSPLEQATKMQEANKRQKDSIDRLMVERKMMLDLFYELWHEVEMPRQAAHLYRLLKENGYDLHEG